MNIGTGIGIPFSNSVKRVVVRDGFGRADNAASMGATELGNRPWTYNGTWGIIGNKAYNVNTDTSDHHTVVDTGISNNFFIEVDVGYVATEACGLTARYASTSSWLIYWLDQSGGLIVARAYNGYTALGQKANAVALVNATHRLRLEVRGNSIDAFLNGVRQLSVVDSSGGLNANTKHGLFRNAKTSAATNTRFDNFRMGVL